MPLTDLKIRTLKPEAKSRKYTGGGNMYLELKPNGSKLWKMSYTYTGKQKAFSFRPHPRTKLAKAREESWEARTILRDGIAPIVHASEVEAQRQAEFGNPFS